MTAVHQAPPVTIDTLLRYDTDRAAFITATGTLSPADIADHAESLRRRWHGAVPAGPVALSRQDPIAFARDFLALLAVGATVAPLDPNLPAAAFRADLLDLRPGLVLADDLPPGAPEGWRPAGPGAVLLRSSGTTGPRKNVLLDQTRLLHTAGAVATAHRLGPHDRGLSPLPLFHVNAEVVGLLSTLICGGSLVLDDRFHRSSFWTTARHHEVSWINAVPAIITLLAHDPAPVIAPAGIRFVRSASAPLPVAVLRRFEDRFAIPVIETYGMTEAASQICANPLDGPRKPGSVGLPAGTDVRVDAPDGDIGEVHIRGGGVVPGPLPDGWLPTGDLGFRDRDGYLFLTGRTTQVINRGGEKVFPRHVEEELLCDPRVRDAVVVGWPDPVLGEVPVAFVTVHVDLTLDGAHTVARELLDACVEALPRARRPSAVHVVTALPTGPTGKPSRALIHTTAATLAATALARAALPKTDHDRLTSFAPTGR